MSFSLEFIFLWIDVENFTRAHKLPLPSCSFGKLWQSCFDTPKKMDHVCDAGLKLFNRSIHIVFKPIQA